MQRQIGCHLAGRRDAALMNAGALHNPFVGRVDHLGQFGIGQDALRQVTAGAENDGTNGHDAVPAAVGSASTRGSRLSICEIFASNS